MLLVFTCSASPRVILYDVYNFVLSVCIVYMGNVTFRQSPCWQTPLSLTHLCQHVRSNGRKAQGFPLSLPLTISGAGGVICHTAHSWSLLRLSKLASFCLAMLSCVGLALQCFGSSLRSWAWRARCLASEALTYVLFVFTVVYYFLDYRLAELLFGLSFHVAQSRNRLLINFTQSLTPDILLTTYISRLRGVEM